MQASLSVLIKPFFLFFILIIPNLANASTTDGIIDSAYHYAWSENAGWIDFGSPAGSVHVTDTAVTGSVYGKNIGWITLNPQTYGGVINDGAGNLSGYAWGENIGWVDFSKVSIGSDGVFTGGAYSKNIGWVTFGTVNNKVSTDWRPSSIRTPVPDPTPIPPATSGGGGGSGGGGFIIPPSAPPTSSPIPATSLPVDVTPTTPLPVVVSSLDSFTTLPLPFVNKLSVGSVGEDVKQLQQFLNNTGFLISTTGNGSVGNETTYFGFATQKALAAFQAANGISPANGYFGPITKAFIENLIQTAPGKIEVPESPKPTLPVDISTPTNPTPSPSKSVTSDPLPFVNKLSVGSVGEDVKQLQQFLNNTGFLISTTGNGSVGNETTYFGFATQKALAAFQAANGISPANGYFGPKTIGFIKKLESTP